VRATRPKRAIVEVVLGALRDAEQSLARFGQQRANVAALAQISRQADTAAELNEQRRAAGVISQGELNTSIRKREQARANLDRAIAAMTNGWIAIQKSLGLGWVELSRDNRTSVEPAPVDRKSVMKPEQS